MPASGPSRSKKMIGGTPLAASVIPFTVAVTEALIPLTSGGTVYKALEIVEYRHP